MIKSHIKNVKLENVEIHGDRFFKISNIDQLKTFFISIVSPSNHWMFVTSNGGITAGRKNSDLSLFPYYTDDKIGETAENTGSKTIIIVKNKSQISPWVPFTENYYKKYNYTRNLYKNQYGNKVIFEEINHDLNLRFSYQWSTSDKYGIIKKSAVENLSPNVQVLKVMDGIQNILPFGVLAELQNTFSNLANAYKKNELIQDIGCAIYSLSAQIIDRAEPYEALKATTCWSVGLENSNYLLSNLQLEQFYKTGQVTEEVEIRAEKGAYYVVADLTLKNDQQNEWLFVAEVGQDHSAISSLLKAIREDNDLFDSVEGDIDLGTKELTQLVGSADGLQLSRNYLQDSRHFSNTLFNIMRGGIFDNQYLFDQSDVSHYFENANQHLYHRLKTHIDSLPSKFHFMKMYEIIPDHKTDAADFKRLSIEYLPLKFSRRHGDPSRPWNRFSINLKSDVDESTILHYQGNWRDIFQNWEALVHSYPYFIGSMIFKFLNASTFDGYNPYRVTKDGFDWEVIELDNPWSYIGYWGDHQIIYLLKFLEFSQAYFPGKLTSLLNRECFVYANVPYRIKDYQSILDNPKSTIVFDFELHENILKRKEMIGSDGALLTDSNGLIYRVTMIEKYLAILTSKLTNFIPDGGIWLNTQRPEWNDANNALVGNGVSMVTLYYLRRFLRCLNKIIQDSSVQSFKVSEALKICFMLHFDTLFHWRESLKEGFSDFERKKIMDELGQAGSNYRSQIYTAGFDGIKSNIEKEKLIDFINILGEFIDSSMESNLISSGLYHSYNLVSFDVENKASIDHHRLMLEGQVAVISSGKLQLQEVIKLLDSLKSSKLYRQDQNSYLLYPDKELPLFVHKNIIPKKWVEKSKLLSRLIKDGNKQIILRDVMGDYHFNGNFRNVNDLELELKKLHQTYEQLVGSERKILHQIFDDIFNHKAYTGRSETFFGYEGLGSIYWHMVSKLRLAVFEYCKKMIIEKQNSDLVDQLVNHYYHIVDGIGVNKSPARYGAFPTDPYSHTPAGKGAQQPGMTGQVKEDWLCRMGELGVSVANGQLSFRPLILRKKEFLKELKPFKYFDTNGKIKQIYLNRGELAFTYCQVPIVYQIGVREKIIFTCSDRQCVELNQSTIDVQLSNKIFGRTGEIKRIEVEIPDYLLR